MKLGILICDDYETMSIEEARELTLAAVRDEYALNHDMPQSSSMQ